MFPTLNIIGCGRLGKTLARLWHDNKLLTIQQIMNNSSASTQAAVEFIGAGTGVQSYQDFTSADLWLIASDDHSISTIAQELAAAAPIKPGDIVFHCSGSQSSDLLKPFKNKGATIASIHPIHGFTHPETSINTFSGSFCAVEGDNEAIAILSPLFERIGGQIIPIESENKLLYHTASVMGCNYLIGLLDASQECFELSGIARDQSSEMLRPILHAIVDSVLDTSARDALVGPISRGDVATVETQLEALKEKASELAEIYRVMGLRNRNIAEETGKLSSGKLEKLLKVLTKTPH